MPLLQSFDDALSLPRGFRGDWSDRATPAIQAYANFLAALTAPTTRKHAIGQGIPFWIRPHADPYYDQPLFD